MKKIVSLVLMVAMLMTGLVAVAEGTTDEFDVSVDAQRLASWASQRFHPLPELKSKADSLWDAGDLQAAAEAIVYAKNANWLAI